MKKKFNRHMVLKKGTLNDEILNENLVTFVI